MLEIQFTSTTISKAGIIENAPYLYNVSVEIVNNILANVTFNIQKSVTKTDDETQTSLDENEYIGSIRQEGGRNFLDFIVGEDPIPHLTIFNQSVNSIQTDIDNVLKEIGQPTEAE